MSKMLIALTLLSIFVAVGCRSETHQHVQRIMDFAAFYPSYALLDSARRRQFQPAFDAV